MDSASCFCLAVPATQPLPAQTASVDARLATQNALFEELSQADLKNAPERATACGDYRYNDQLSDRSLAAIDRRHTADAANLSRLQAIPHHRLPRTGHALPRPPQPRPPAAPGRLRPQRIRDTRRPEERHPHRPRRPSPRYPFDSVKHYEDYIARLHQIPRVLSQTTEVLRAGMKDNFMPVRFLLEKVPGQCNGIIEADPS